MQKSADIASVATRLNNLEQKFEELPEGGDGDLATMNRIFSMLADGAQISAAPSQKWNAFLFFDYGKSLTQLTFGDANGVESNNYLAAQEVPFFTKVFQTSDWMNHQVSGGYRPELSFAAKILGGYAHDARLVQLANIGLEDDETPVTDATYLSFIEATQNTLSRLSQKIDKIIDQELPAIKARLAALES
ncbi:hypothetical protein D7027_02015 [Ochrobactrum intermedium]|uniref:hypothetical protein n=1 Tax=Brucella intermedia TaxID=94625 RepID=UPI00128B25AD|nr:hypothetical protein [Brucella intermedia]MPR60607.1 hypothetical protein [Brucella intermedia]